MSVPLELLNVGGGIPSTNPEVLAENGRLKEQLQYLQTIMGLARDALPLVHEDGAARAILSGNLSIEKCYELKESPGTHAHALRIQFDLSGFITLLAELKRALKDEQNKIKELSQQAEKLYRDLKEKVPKEILRLQVESIKRETWGKSADRLYDERLIAQWDEVGAEYEHLVNLRETLATAKLA